jgi:hypothetical protein
MRFTTPVSITLMLIFAMPAVAEVYKCNTNHGISFQQVPCDPGTGGKIEIAGSEGSDPTKPRHETSPLLRDAPLSIGMTESQVIKLWGKPNKINKTLNSSGLTEQWIYRLPWETSADYVYFSNGKVTSISVN